MSQANTPKTRNIKFTNLNNAILHYFLLFSLEKYDFFVDIHFTEDYQFTGTMLNTTKMRI